VAWAAWTCNPQAGAVVAPVVKNQRRRDFPAGVDFLLVLVGQVGQVGTQKTKPPGGKAAGRMVYPEFRS
jgi:hypothetical protein